MYQYKVSVIMAVYKVEPFLREAIDSVIGQTIGFDNIQLILVDDGSPDGSGIICDQYAAKYPDNIVVIHKENGGVSSARNEGLRHVRGQFVNFLDSDDKLTENTVEDVYRFFMDNLDRTDMVSFPMKFFDGDHGEHILNYKYDGGNRVVDLREDWQNPQLSLSSAFIKAECITPLRFDARLAFAEDAQIVQRILAEKCTLGVVQSAAYMYRRRTVGSQSAIQSSEYRSGWYLSYMRYFQRETIEYYLSRMGEVPLFVQNTLMYDLQWRIRQKAIPQGVLTDDQKEEYLEDLRWVLGHIDDEVIEAQRNLTPERKALAMRIKYADTASRAVCDGDVGVRFGGRVRFPLSESPLLLEFFRLEEDECVVEGVYSVLPELEQGICVAVQCGDRIFHSEASVRRMPTVGMERVIQEHITFRIRIPLEKGKKTRIRFLCAAEDMLIPLRQIRFGSFFPVSDVYKNEFYAKKDWIMRWAEGGVLCVEPRTRSLRAYENALCKEIWTRNEVGGRKAVLSRIILRFLKLFKRKPLLLVSDRVMKAGDNGEAFFRYMRQEHPEVDTRFVISEHCPDYAAMGQIGPVLKTDSYLHKFCLLLSDCVVSSSAEVEVYNPFIRYIEPYRSLITNVKFVFLQHGVIKDDLSQWAGRFNKNMTGFVTSARPEYESILYGAYEYSDKEVWLTGLPRFDRLYRDEQKWITIMPTWRRYLMGRFDKETDTWTLAPNAENSSFVRFYDALLNDERLLRAAKEYGYQIKFLPHPNFQAHLHLFRKNDDVAYLGREMSYRDVYARSELVVTDYSSAVFDFLYLRKPVIYTQFDQQDFFAGEHIYSKGYFDYERDGFGEVEYDLEGTVSRMIEYMENGCRMKDQYRSRVDNFFAYDDQKNCQRVYEKIREVCDL